MLTFKCKDMGMEDEFEIKDENEEEIVQLITLHAQKTHGIKKMTPEMLNKIKRAIKDDNNCGATCSDFA
jgi:predicted small metal-binding protein